MFYVERSTCFAEASTFNVDRDVCFVDVRFKRNGYRVFYVDACFEWRVGVTGIWLRAECLRLGGCQRFVVEALLGGFPLF